MYAYLRSQVPQPNVVVRLPTNKIHYRKLEFSNISKIENLGKVSRMSKTMYSQLFVTLFYLALEYIKIISLHHFPCHHLRNKSLFVMSGVEYEATAYRENQ